MVKNKPIAHASSASAELRNPELIRLTSLQLVGITLETLNADLEVIEKLKLKQKGFKEQERIAIAKRLSCAIFVLRAGIQDIAGRIIDDLVKEILLLRESKTTEEARGDSHELVDHVQDLGI